MKAAPFPEPEEELYGVAVNGKMYVIGGFGYMPFGNPPGLVYEYDPGPDKWTKKKTCRSRVHHQAQAVFNGKIYIFGGCMRAISGEGGRTNAWEYDPATDTYKALAPMPVKRCSAVAAEVDGKIYLIGGLEPFENGKGTRVTGRNQMYDPATNTWTETQPDADDAQPRVLGAVNGKIYVIGGRLGAGNIPVQHQHRHRRGVRPRDQPVGRRQAAHADRRAAAAARRPTTERSTSAAANGSRAS